MKVPTKSHSRQLGALWEELQPLLEDALLRDDPVLGDSLQAFEAALAAYHGVEHAVGVGSGSDALVLAIQGVGLGPNAEVLTSAHTFSGVLSAIFRAGARPLLADPDPDSGLLDPGRAEAALTPATRAILVVHLYGHPVDLDGFRALCARRGLVLLEDACQAHGARWNGRPVGSVGRATALSFHPSKNLGAFGDGGAVLTDDPVLADWLRVERNMGKRGKYVFERIAPNTKLDTLQAAILRLKLRHLDGWVERRREIAARYLDGLKDVEGLRLPREDRRARHAYHLFVVRTSERERFRSFLAEAGVATGVHYPVSAPRQPAFAAHFRGARFPVADAWADQVVSLPASHEHRDAEIDRVIEVVRAFPWA